MFSGDNSLSQPPIFDFDFTYPESQSISTDNVNLLTPASDGIFQEQGSESSLVGSDSIANSQIFESQPEPVKLKPGRKRKGDNIDRVALRRERVVRNRLSAQRSRERKKLEKLTSEKEKEQLKKQNSLLTEKVKSLEASNELLLSKLDLLSSQMINIQSLFQVQSQFNNEPSMLFNGFGEPAELTVGVRNSSLSQQRKPLKMIQDHKVLVYLTLETIRLFILTFWLTHQLISISLFQPGTTGYIHLISYLKTVSLSPFESAYISKHHPFLNFPLPNSTEKDYSAYFKWFPPRLD